MAKARITIQWDSAVPGGELQIFVNPEGRELLMEELQALSAENDHFHLWPRDPDGQARGAAPLELKAYGEGRVVDYAKVCLRLDEWDREHYPYVLAED